MHYDISFPHLGITLSHVGKSVSVFGFEIAYYGMIIGTAILIGFWIAMSEAERTGQNSLIQKGGQEEQTVIQ